MAEADELLPPLEIPWKLASTTQPLSASEPAQTALSLFSFEPDDTAITGLFPDEKVIFLKFTASISPASFPKELSRVAASFLGEGIPCMHLLLDLKVRNASDEAGTIRPYFHAAAPLNRRMVQTGIVGDDAVRRRVRRSHGRQKRLTNARVVAQQLDDQLGQRGGGLLHRLLLDWRFGPHDIHRRCEQPRRVASSRHDQPAGLGGTARAVQPQTRVENIISLLNAKYVGTPHLSFSLSPQPLQQLSIDPSDPNLWFQQLLARRSAGIEGIQEFTAVMVVPKDTAFCVNARLRRVCLLDSPPGPLSFEERFNGTLPQLARMVNYLNRTFPIGTPLEDLDIDIIPGITGTWRIQAPGCGAMGPAAGSKA